ncbi:sugar kinase [Ovoidimarina sediminis]|uniref:sugar kinase n=1 Tax=Ovoidimarina sediminis TaxID=3079856 RepID=UPI0029144417|nr:sugar kinase [Rhodophyticola sp. MJ-SS7]MDU8942076.1 sugar kinase [Rhodophyticola sp. MJ-SS7]
MSGPISIAAIGEAMVELSLRPETPDRAGLGFAGDTLNTAIYLKRAAPEFEVAYVTRLGTDNLSDRMIEMIASEGISTGLIGRDPSRAPGLYAISTDESGERSFSYWRDTSAAKRLFSEEPPSIEALSGFTVIYASAISLAVISPEARSDLFRWLTGFRERGGRFAFDSNFRPALWPDRRTAQSEIEKAWRMADIGLPSVDDEMALFGDHNAEDVLTRLREWGVSRGALKRGAHGPVAIDGSDAGPFATVRKVVDSTAAGDSFNAAYLAAHLEGRPERECLIAGHTLATRVIGVPGAILPREQPGI